MNPFVPLSRFSGYDHFATLALCPWKLTAHIVVFYAHEKCPPFGRLWATLEEEELSWATH